MAFGIISIIAYLLFLTWAQLSAPKGDNRIPESGSFYDLASALLMAFSVHDFIVQNIIKNPHRQDYIKIVLLTFIIGTAAYMFITLGSFGIIVIIKLSSIGIPSSQIPKQSRIIFTMDNGKL